MCVWLVVDIFCVITLRYTWTIVELLLDSDGGSSVASVGEHDILVPSANGEPCRVRLSIRKLAYVCCGGLFNPGAFLCCSEEEEGDGGKGFLHISSHSLLYLILTFFRRLANRVLFLRPCVKSQAIIVCSFRYCLILLGFVCCLT